MASLKKGKARQGSLVIIGWKRYWYLCTCSTREMAMSSSRPLLLRSWSREQNKFSLSNKIFLKRSERVASVSCKACKIPEICQHACNTLNTCSLPLFCSRAKGREEQGLVNGEECVELKLLCYKFDSSTCCVMVRRVWRWQLNELYFRTLTFAKS